MRLFLLSLLISLFSFSFSQNNLYKEKYRPQFHFSPSINWCNDPNGLVYFNGEYHLFYQHNPFGNVWGHMSWGHAVSTDLVKWKHLPLAIPEENGVMIFSGTCIADINNSSWLAETPGQVPLVAIYTGHIENVNQSQHLAYSLDNGITWTKYAGNPILDLHKKDFRDPKVFWYEPQKKWVMVTVFPIEKQIVFFSSTNLLQWTMMSRFGPAGDTSGIWECPDLFEVPVKNEPGKTKWILMHSPAPYMQYFVGEFDGTNFSNESKGDKIYRPDYGSDYYAAIAYNQLPAGHLPTTIGWINNWNYANAIPTTPWKSAMSIPRSISLKKINGEWIMIQQSVTALKTLRSSPIKLKNKTIENVRVLKTKSQQFELEAVIEPGNNSICGIKIAVGNGRELEIGYNAASEILYIDRNKTGNQTFDSSFKRLSRKETPLSLTNNQLHLHLLFDHSIVEVFANDGEKVMTMQLFPDKEDNGIELFSTGTKSRLVKLKVWKLKSVW